jgi:hypothetical protein
VWLGSLALSFAGCRRTEPAPTAPPPSRGAVAELEPGEAPVDGGVQLAPTLPAELLSAAYACWFERPYALMFDAGPRTVDLGTGPYGRFMAGIGGILHYGSLTGCFGDQVDVEKSSYSSLEPWTRLSGVPVWLAERGPHGFGHVNPEIIRWGEHALLIDPETPLAAGVSAGEVYAVVFARFFRMMAHAYAELRSGEYSREVERYLGAVAAGEDGIDYLESRFAGRLRDYGGAGDGTQMTPAMAFGFWLRRRADGTSEILWSSLRRLLDAYDRQWLRDLDAGYGTHIR